MSAQPGAGRCGACLTAGRRLAAPEPSVAGLLRGCITRYEGEMGAVHVCWECGAVLRRMLQLQRRASRARDWLEWALGRPGEEVMPLATTFSTLGTTLITSETFVTSELQQSDAECSTDSSNLCFESEETDRGDLDAVGVDTELKFKLDTGPLVGVGKEDRIHEPPASGAEPIIEITLDEEHKSAKKKVKKRNQKKRDIVKKTNKGETFEKDKKYAKSRLKKSAKSANDTKRKYTRQGEMFDMVVMDEDQLMELRKEQRVAQSFQRFPHKCDSCIFGFVGEKQLAKHNAQAHSTKAGPFACGVCDTRLGSAVKLAAHSKQHYACIRCRRCGERFTLRNRQAAYRHYRSHESGRGLAARKRYGTLRAVPLSEAEMLRARAAQLAAAWYRRSKFRCDACAIMFPSRAQRDYHERTRHHECVGRFVCAICTARAPSKALLERHVGAHYRRYECAECGAAFPRKDTADTHYRRAHRLGKLFRCDYCSETFMKQRDALAHRGTHTAFPCRLCGRVFPAHQKLQSHLHKLREDKAHNGSQSAGGARCADCDRLFTSDVKLRRHLASHKPRLCPHCGRTFASPQRLRSHCLRAHAPAAPPRDPSAAYCVECDKQFGAAAAYRRHLAAKHAPGPGPTLHACTDCDKTFQSVRSLRGHHNLAHLRRADHRCDACGKCFTSGGSLRRHAQYVHARAPKPRRHACDLCDRAFTAKLVLENHRRTHTGERPFQCGVCDATFTQKVSLRLHARKTHSEEHEERCREAPVQF